MLKLIMLAIGITVPAISLAQESMENLAVDGEWQVSADEDSCHLLARFGSGDGAVIAHFTRNEPGDHFGISLYGKRFDTPTRDVEATIDFGLKDTPKATRVSYGTMGKLPAAFFLSERLDGWSMTAATDAIPEVTPAQEAAVSGLTVAINGQSPFRLTFGSLGEPFGQMRRCMRQLVEKWGYDADVMAGLRRRPKPVGSPAEWISRANYPRRALQEGRSGVVWLRMDVDQDGRVSDCHVISRISAVEFGPETCVAVKKRGVLQPALDAEGKPVRAPKVLRVAWATGK